MITWIQLKLDMPSQLKSTNVSSAFHGALVELLSVETQALLHTAQSYSPLKQRLLVKSDDVVWELVAFDSTLGDELKALFTSKSSIFIKYHATEITFLDKNVTTINTKDLMFEKLNSSEIRKIIDLVFITPTSFKSDGNYDLFPDVVKIFRSIMLMVDTFYNDFNLFDVDTLNFIKNNVHIIDYKLKSTRFHVEGVKIPAFVGDIRIKVNGPPQLVRFVNLLVEFGMYSGVGIKTSLGMGKYIIK